MIATARLNWGARRTARHVGESEDHGKAHGGIMGHGEACGGSVGHCEARGGSEKHDGQSQRAPSNVHS